MGCNWPPTSSDEVFRDDTMIEVTEAGQRMAAASLQWKGNRTKQEVISPEVAEPVETASGLSRMVRLGEPIRELRGFEPNLQFFGQAPGPHHGSGSRALDADLVPLPSRSKKTFRKPKSVCRCRSHLAAPSGRTSPSEVVQSEMRRLKAQSLGMGLRIIHPLQSAMLCGL